MSEEKALPHSSEEPVLLKRAISPFQADVWRVTRPGGLAVRKSFERQPWLLRATFGAWITAREARNLHHLAGIEGIPTLLDRPQPWAFEMSFMEAERLPPYDARSMIGPDYFDALDAIVAEMHARGMSHGDLRRRNLLRHPGTGRPVVLDFTQSLNRSNWLLRPMLPLAFRIDRAQLLKMRAWYVGEENLTKEQQQEAENCAPGWMRLGRYLRLRIYRPLKYWCLGKTPRPRRAERERRRREG